MAETPEQSLQAAADGMMADRAAQVESGLSQMLSVLPPEERLKQEKAEREMHVLDVQNLADLFQQFLKVATYLIAQIQEERKSLERVLKDILEVRDVMLGEAEREILWFQAVQGEFLIEEVPAPEGKKPLKAKVKQP